MSVEKAKEFLDSVKEKAKDEAWAAKAAAAKTEEEKLGLAALMAKEAGFDVTAEEIKEALAALVNEDNDLRPLDDAEAAKVAGGKDEADERHLICDKCKKMTLHYFTGETKWWFWYMEPREYRCGVCGTTQWA